MKKTVIYLSAPLLLVSALAVASPHAQPDDHQGPRMHEMMPPPPPRPMPVFAVTETTTTPAETLKNLAAQVPQTEAGKYQVRIEVLPLPPAPKPPAQ